MLNNISWQNYWIFIGVTTFAYYLVVWLTFLRKSVSLRTIFGRWYFTNSQDRQSLPHPNMISNTEYEESIVHACMDELNAFFDNQKKSKSVKTELMYSLYSILQKYPSLKNSDYKESLTNVIAVQCENICSTHLSAEEMKGVWFG